MYLIPIASNTKYPYIDTRLSIDMDKEKKANTAHKCILKLKAYRLLLFEGNRSIKHKQYNK